MNNTEIVRFVKESNFAVKRLEGQRASVRGDFVFRTLRYRIEGEVDLAGRRPKIFRHRLAFGRKPVFDLTVISGQERTRAEFQFGEKEGTRTLILEAETIARGVLVTGHADGDELLPFLASGCGCSTDGASSARPLLAWKDSTSTRTVSLPLPAAVSRDVGGLAHVMGQTSAQMAASTGLGDLIDVLLYGLCVLKCVGEGLFCWFGTRGLPNPPIFNAGCIVNFTACMGLCKITHPF